MADLSNAYWNEVDANNNNASPNGWPEGMMPSGVNDSARADKGALKRFWDRINPVNSLTPSGGLWTFTTSNPSYPSAYVDGEVFTFATAFASSANDQFRVNALPAKPIMVQRNGAWGPIAAYDIVSSHTPVLIHLTGLNAGAGGFALVNPHVPVLADGSPYGGSMSGNLTVGGSAAVTGTLTAAAVNATNFTASNDVNVPHLYVSAFAQITGTGTALTVSGTATFSAAAIITGQWGIRYASLDPSSFIGFSWNGLQLTAYANGTTLGPVVTTPGGNINIAGTLTAAGVTTSGTVTAGTLVSSGTSTLNGAVTLNAGGTALTVANGGIVAATGIASGGDSTAVLAIRAGTQGYKPGGGMWADSSDVRTKADVADYTTGLAAIRQLRCRTFRHNGRGGTVDDGRTFVGLVANEVLPVMPEMIGRLEERLEVGDAEPTEILTLDATALVYALTNAVKELAAEIDSLKSGEPHAADGPNPSPRPHRR